VSDVLPVEDHAEPEVVPLRDDQLGRVAGDAGGDRLPLAAGGGDRPEREPTPVADLDRVAAFPRGEQLQNPALEKGRVHAELQGHAPPEPGAQVLDVLRDPKELGAVQLFGRTEVAESSVGPPRPVA